VQQVYASGRLDTGSLVSFENLHYGFDISDSSYNSSDDSYNMVPYNQGQDSQIEFEVCM
jgi:hypothetical protein